MAEQSFLGGESENTPYPTIWEELKYRMQGAFLVLAGESAAVDFKQLEDMALSHSIMQDDLAYSDQRNMQKDFEGLLPENCTPQEADQMAQKIRDFINDWGAEIADPKSSPEIDLDIER